MSHMFLKSAQGAAVANGADAGAVVAEMLARIEREGEAAVIDYAARLDGWTGPIVVPEAQIVAAEAELDEGLKADIRYAHENIRDFALAQRLSAQDMEIELRPGLFAGQRHIPLATAGCYVPGGRYAHIASALMTITTARTAGVRQVIACTPARGAGGPAPAVLYAMKVAGADRILCLGGVQGVAALAHGFFGCAPADILVGPGNQFVAEAKRQMFGPVGIDMFAGPTDSMILADETADALTVAWDLVGQAEHGQNSPVCLVTTHKPLAREVLRLMPRCIAELPESNGAAARAAWDALGEVVLCDGAEAMAAFADRAGPEHLHVQARDLEWWKQRLTSYGSLFLGQNTTVAFGDKAAGPNHVLPTSGAARYTGGLSVHKFLKTVTWQRVEDEALPALAQATANISRHEGMEGHARTADIRLARLSPAPMVAGH
ncbi:histidinol dehydrogenase [Albibacillus kandeliae]|uniref:histidinol dehydrogenase n=1 Tax=Albibacillus kandeliae TaxID=2174228 RepID=UPI000D69DEE0|nr:histidinol dehydrogenase [Albibacillus kandeliae]